MAAGDASSSIPQSKRRFWFLGLIIIGGLVAVFLFGLGPFLARTAAVDGQVLVVEAWIWDRYDFHDAIREFGQHSYKRLIVVGGAMEEKISTGTVETSSEVAAQRLRELNFDEHLLTVLITPATKMDRTYTSGTCVRAWLSKNEPEVNAINLITVGAHARKSQLLFQKALGPSVAVGVIAGKQNRYSLRWWWLQPTGLRLVLRNLAGWLYYRFLWSPPTTAH